MKKFFSIVILYIILIFSINIPVLAAELFSEKSYGISYGAEEITVAAKSIYPKTRVTLIVLNPGKTLSDVGNDAASLQYQRDIMSDENGLFSKVFTLNTSGIDMTIDQTFSVYAKIPGYAIEKIIDVVYKSANSRLSLLEELKKGVSEIETLLSVEENCVALGISGTEAFKSVNKTKLAQSLEGNFSSFSSDEAGYDAACESLREFCVLELFNQGLADKVYDSDGNYLQKELLDFSDYDKKNGTSIYECYLDEISADAQSKVRETLFNKSFETPEALYKMLATETVLKGVTSPKLTGYAHVGELLTQKNREFLGINISGTITGNTEALISGSGNVFSTVLELENYINSIIGYVEYQPPVIGSGDGGGGYSAPPIKVDETVVKEEKPALVNAFFDVPESHWASKAVIYLKVNNIISGSGDNKFLPDDYVTREQLVKMVLMANGEQISETQEADFADVNPEMWYAPYVATAFEKGYVNGISQTEFGVGKYATRQDICVIINRIAAFEASVDNKFADNDLIADYAKEAVSALSLKGIVNGYPDGSFGPHKYCTRAEMATIIYRLIELKNN